MLFGVGKETRKIDFLNPYSASNFCPDNAVCLLRLLHIFKGTLE